MLKEAGIYNNMFWLVLSKTLFHDEYTFIMGITSVKKINILLQYLYNSNIVCSILYACGITIFVITVMIIKIII